MALARDMNIKPSCLQEMYALPPQMLGQVVEKFTYLAQDPIPDGHLKKKLRGSTDLYRLRIGDYRVVYTFGTDWIRLLCIRPRKDVYESRDLAPERPRTITAATVAPDLADLRDPDDDDVLLTGPEAAWVPRQAPDARPVQLTAEWLTQLKIPDEYQAAFLACRSEDDVLEVAAPEALVWRVVENLFPRPIDEVVQQPDLVVADTRDLQEYVEGDLLGFLLRLDADQERLVDWALRGPALIRGGPGTGKSTIALYRVRSLLDHAQAAGEPTPRILFSTYTPALTRFSEQLLEQLLGERMRHVRVESADDLARRIVTVHEPVAQVADRQELLHRMARLLAERQATLPPAVAALRPEYLLDEIEWVIEGRALKSQDEYLAVDRPGRGTPLAESARRAVLDVYAAYRDALAAAGVWTAARLQVRALELVQSGAYAERYDAVLIDEAQDLPPAALALLVELARDARGVYLTADASQSIYFRGFSWQSVHDRLRLRGKTIALRRNYRSTREIARAAVDFLLGSGAGEAELANLQSGQSGPQPALLAYGSDAEQWAHAADFIRQMARQVRLRPAAAAVLVPSAAVGEAAEAALKALGLPARFMRGSQLNLAADVVKILTLQAAKGLEFPIVVVAGLHEKQFPRLPEGLDDAERQEELQTARRTLFVGMTRAMRALLVLYPQRHGSPLVGELRAELWARAGM